MSLKRLIFLTELHFQPKSRTKRGIFYDDEDDEEDDSESESESEEDEMPSFMDAGRLLSNSAFSKISETLG